eukprot:SM000036S13301  [mRNA]  locus=s36:396602:401301:- [translate_table: standard]
MMRRKDEDMEDLQFQANYTILSEKDVLHREAEAVDSVSTVLSVSRTEAGILLRHFKWSVSRVNDEWFADEEAVRRAVGLLCPSSDALRERSEELTCGICFESHSSDYMHAPACATHFFCEACWQGYMHSAIGDGPGCLTLRCPDPSCGAAVGEDMVLSLVDAEHRAKYTRYLLRSYIEDNRKAKWCPAPGCEYAVEYEGGTASNDIICQCGHNFCWNCLEEAHRPVDCGTVAKWILKNSAESENMNWILANSKPCPKCKRPIEKNQGLCLGAWGDHGERTGGFYACNRYETAKQEGVYDETERRREMAKNSLERYTHYYERWATNESSRMKALEDLRQMLLDKVVVHMIEILSDKQCQPVSQLKFVPEAWLQIVECRRVLKWTYAYGYYLPEAESAKRVFFEYVQGEAEAALERLHQCAEKELNVFLNGETPHTSFNEFRTKLAGLTSVTRTYFENLVKALENNLADVDNSRSAFGKGAKAAGASKGKAAKHRGGGLGMSSSGRGGGGPSFVASRSATGTGASSEEDYWSCEHCTLANPGSMHVCGVCRQPRSS